jgi:hypothetical protein
VRNFRTYSALKIKPQTKIFPKNPQVNAKPKTAQQNNSQKVKDFRREPASTHRQLLSLRFLKQNPSAQVYNNECLRELRPHSQEQKATWHAQGGDGQSLIGFGKCLNLQQKID